MIRLFNVYYPVRAVALFGGEALIVCASFLLACQIQLGPDTYLVLNYEMGFYKVFGVSGLALLILYYFDLYDLPWLRASGELFFRLLVVVGVLSLCLAALGALFPALTLGQSVYLTGLSILTVGLFGWRLSFGWLMQRPLFRERVYILGAGDRASRMVEAIRGRPDLGMEVVGWTNALGESSTVREELGDRLRALKEQGMDRVIVALSDRRGRMPVRELLDLRTRGVLVEDSGALMEKISGKVEVDEMHPSWLIFSDGFRLKSSFLMLRRLFSFALSLGCLLVCLPLIPIIMLLVKVTSPGPILYRQKRVGRNGVVFACYKFRTMREDAEADSGATWASDRDPRVTPFGQLLRRTRLDEIPQLWNVLKGDMAFVGPRPERPEFVEWLAQEIPYYPLRHAIRPGLTGWAQVNYGYGASVEDAKEKLRYDLYYIKNLSLALDLLIVFQTLKTVLFGRGVR